MSVLVSKRRTSKLEVLVHADELYKMIVELTINDLGLKDMERFFRRKYWRRDDKEKLIPKAISQLTIIMKNLEENARLICNDLQLANSIYPQNMHEYELRREHQDYAMARCYQLLRLFQNIIDIFDVDVNVYERYVLAINREIDLIKDWRRSDNRIKARLQGNI